MKKLISLLLCLALSLSLVSVSFAEDVPNLANTYYSYGYDVGFWMDYFFHFYDEVPGIGRVFYAGYALNQIVYTGTYEVIAEERAYQCWPDRATSEAAEEGAEIPTGTAPYTVIFYDFDGNEIDRCALDETHLYNDMETLTGIGGANAVYDLDTDPENSAFAKEYEGEQAVVVLSLVDPDDDTATLELKVNGKYDDLVVLYVEGTYSMNEDQTEITLTPADDSDPGATVTKNEDGTYTYVSTDGDEVVLVEVKGAEVAYQLKGSIPVPGMDGVNADLICDLLDDNTAVIYADFMGNRMDIDKGTYEIDMATYSFVLHLETAGDLTTEGYAADMVLNYKADNVDPFGAIEQTLAFVAE
ncbi:MAG: hypothetical protein IJ153_04160 [Clostridia bacterium]|nr:hypothetical protein [Clostridia bacterium]MBQ9210872.1 hypothetical protein [Clostridia bacterium]